MTIAHLNSVPAECGHSARTASETAAAQVDSARTFHNQPDTRRQPQGALVQGLMR